MGSDGWMHGLFELKPTYASTPSLKKGVPQGQLFVKAACRMRRTGRRQYRARVAELGDLGPEPTRCLPVEGYRAQLRRQLRQPGQIVEMRGPDARIQTAGSLTGRVHVPDSHPAGQQPLQSIRIRKTDQGFFQNRAQDLPELIAWMTVVLPGRKRGRARKTAQHQDAHVGVDDRRESAPLTVGALNRHSGAGR